MPRVRGQRARQGRQTRDFFSYGLGEPSERAETDSPIPASPPTSEPDVPTPSSQTVLEPPAAKSGRDSRQSEKPENQKRVGDLPEARRNEALKLIDCAYEEGRRTFDKEQSGNGDFVEKFTQAFLHIEHSKRLWKVDHDIIETIANACKSGRLQELDAVEDPVTKLFKVRSRSGSTEAETLESIRCAFYDWATELWANLPKKPNFKSEPTDAFLDPVHFFVYIGFITIRAHLRGRRSLDYSGASLQVLLKTRRSAMASEENFFPERVLEEDDLMARATAKSQKKAAKRAAQKARKAAKENGAPATTETTSDDLNGDETPATDHHHGAANAETAADVPTEAPTENRFLRVPVDNHAATAREPERGNGHHPSAQSITSLPTKARPGHIATDDPVTAMEMATEALAMYGARPPPGLSAFIGAPITRRNMGPSHTSATADPTANSDASMMPNPRSPLLSRANGSGRRVPAATSDQSNSSSLLGPVPPRNPIRQSETIEEWQRRTGPQPAPVPSTYTFSSANNTENSASLNSEGSITATMNPPAGATAAASNPSVPSVNLPNYPRTAAPMRPATKELYDQINDCLEANASLPPAERRAKFAQFKQKILRSETLAAVRGEQKLRPTATAATQAALAEGRDDALNAVREQRRAAEAVAGRRRRAPRRPGAAAAPSRPSSPPVTRRQGSRIPVREYPASVALVSPAGLARAAATAPSEASGSGATPATAPAAVPARPVTLGTAPTVPTFDIGGMPGWLGELEAMQISGRAGRNIEPDGVLERMRLVYERRAAAFADIMARYNEVDPECEFEKAKKQKEQTKKSEEQ